jgi:pyridoxamine 5'-phosphate oxidase-like protein
MVTWKNFAAAEPDLAAIGRQLLFQFKVGLAFLATVRRDGAPRLHPVCPVLSNDRLFVLVTEASPKRHDLLRDGRYALQTFPQPKPGSDEFYIAGKALLVDDHAARSGILRDAKHMADASETAFELWIDRVMYTRWDHILTPQMRSEHRRWRVPASAAARSAPR